MFVVIVIIVIIIIIMIRRFRWRGCNKKHECVVLCLKQPKRCVGIYMYLPVREHVSARGSYYFIQTHKTRMDQCVYSRAFIHQSKRYTFIYLFILDFKKCNINLDWIRGNAIKQPL